MTLNNAAIELSLTLDWWSDTVGVFEPELVFRRIHQIFPDTIFDPIDYQEQRLRKEVAHWQSAVSHPVQQAKLIQQSKDNYRTNGPTFKCCKLQRRNGSWPLLVNRPGRGILAIVVAVYEEVSHGSVALPPAAGRQFPGQPVVH